MKTKATSNKSFTNILVCVAVFAFHFTMAQNNSIVLNGAYIKMNGGTSSTPLFLVVDQSSTSGIARSSGHIISENQYNYVRWRSATGTGNYVYPFGYSTTDYLPVTLNKTSATSANIDASTWGTDNKNLPHAGPSDGGTLGSAYKMKGIGDSISSVIDRWWDFYPSAALTANIIFSYRGTENSTTTNTADNIDMQHWNGSSWDAPIQGTTTGVTSGVGTLSVSGVSSFSPMIAIHRTGPLPVTISEFNFNCADKGVSLNWATASEFNSDYFKIEKSRDGVNFETIGKVKAAGNSKSLVQYKFIDYNDLGKASYYRLKEVDFDGTTDFSKIVYGNCVYNYTEAISIFPNPVHDFINYNINVQIKGAVTIEVLNQAGLTVLQKQYNALPEFTLPPTDVSLLNEGLYLVKIRDGQKVTLVKFIKVKD